MVATAAPGPRARRGYALLEVQVAFAVFGIGLAGLCPMVVAQIRLLHQLELRLEAQVVGTSLITGQSQTLMQGSTYYILPWSNPWAQKLTGSAPILTSPTNPNDPGPLQPAPMASPTAFPVTIVELDAPPYSQSVTAYVDVSAP
jgi:hypothetical protein